MPAGFGLGLGGTSWGYNMSSIDRAANPCDVDGSMQAETSSVLSGHAWCVIRLIGIVFGAATLAACAQTSLVSQKSTASASRHASLNHARAPSFAPTEQVAFAHRHAPLAPRENAADKTASRGLASFYREGGQTASGERFDAGQLTAAHPTLPFGTKLRVTDVKSGRSVTVRVNDRGPYVPGRIVDVSYSAAQALGMVGKGVANVRLDVVEQ